MIGNLYSSPVRILELRWSIQLPSNSKVHARYETPTSFHGDGYTYTILSVEGDGAGVLDVHQFYYKDQELLLDIYREIPVPQEDQISQMQDMRFLKIKHHADTLIIGYSISQEKYYFYESIF